MNHTQSLMIIIVSTGFFGGVVSYFRYPKSEEGFNYLLFVKSVIFGLAASGLVPLFLKMISSDLLVTSKESDLDFFIIGGFCIISSIFSNNFIESIGKKVLNQIDNINDKVDTVKQEVEEVTTESDNENDSIKSNIINLGLSENDNTILESMVKSKYTYRSVMGISSELGVNKMTIRNGLINLKEKELVKKIKRENGIRYRLTNDGIDYFNSQLRK